MSAQVTKKYIQLSRSKERLLPSLLKSKEIIQQHPGLENRGNYYSSYLQGLKDQSGHKEVTTKPVATPRY